MGINLEKMRAKLAAVQNNGDSSKSAFWRPNDGNQTIRVVPTADGDPFKEVYFHYNVAKGGILCPKRNFGDSCPVCDFASNLRASSSDSDSLARFSSVARRLTVFAGGAMARLPTKVCLI